MPPASPSPKSGEQEGPPASVPVGLLSRVLVATESLRSWRVTKMRLKGTSIAVNESLTLEGIPAEALDYKLGNRSALEWVLDQYKVSTDTAPRGGFYVRTFVHGTGTTRTGGLVNMGQYCPMFKDLGMVALMPPFLLHWHHAHEGRRQRGHIMLLRNPHRLSPLVNPSYP